MAALPRRGIRHHEESKTVLGRPGSDLLSQALRLSTISAEKINGRVRNGIGFELLAKTTRPAENSFLKQASSYFSGCSLVSSCLFSQRNHPKSEMDMDDESNQVDRAISTGKLNTLLYLHTRPINVVVFDGSRGRTRFEVGFPLRCFQRLSRPYIATQHCRWRDNCSTRGTFIPVLSY